MENKRYRWNAIIDRVKYFGLPTIYGAELGVWRAKTSEALLSNMPNLYLTMVDRWAPPEAGDSYATSGSKMALCDINRFEEVYKEALSKIEQYADRCLVYRMTTTEAAKYVKDHSLDFVFIDADHSYEGVKQDILCWKDKVKEGGWLSGHDWGKLDKGNVEKAVREFFPIERIELDCNSTWFIRM